jgi:hypothetical protein
MALSQKRIPYRAKSGLDIHPPCASVSPMKWRTYPMSGAAAERMEQRGLKRPYLDHAVNLDTGRCLCSVSADSLVQDDAFYHEDHLPDCPRCLARIKREGVG